ncbi:MAG TPA: hypothetical protein VJ600_11035 [Holophagaceae bacterium]|nr:hypothetical protein [Holophagaceae bacterium]
MDLERPLSIHSDQGLGPKGPWSFLREAVPGGFTRLGWGLIGGWVLLALVPAFFWASHLASHTAFAGGWSGLTAHWGEQLDSRDLVELFKNGEVHAPLGFMTGASLLLGLALVFGCGWRLQARAAGLQGRLAPWLMGFADTLLVGLIPMGLLAGLSVHLLGLLAGQGLQGLDWTVLILRPILLAASVSALSVQWWILRLGREGLSEEFGTHLGHGFLRLWTHPVQWFTLLAGGATLRMALHLGVLFAAWRLGGSTGGRIWAFTGLELLATAINAWILGWMLRVAALFWRNDVEVRRAVKALKAMVKVPAPEAAGDLPLEVQG